MTTSLWVFCTAGRPQLIPQRGIETYRMFVKVRHQEIWVSPTKYLPLFFTASIATLSPFSNLICCKYPQGSLHLHKMLPVRILLLPHIAEMIKTVNASTVKAQSNIHKPSLLTLTMFKVAIVFLIKFLCNRGVYQPTWSYFVIYGRGCLRSFDLPTQSPKISLSDCMEVSQIASAREWQ